MTTYEQLLAIGASVLPVLACVPLARERPPGRLSAGYAVVVALAAVAWNRHKAPYEGPAILELNGTAGVTVVDLVTPVGLAVAAAVLYRWWRGRSPD